MALLQTEVFFKKHPAIRLMESHDTAGSARFIARNQLKRTGAIGSAAAARMYGLSILASDIETEKENFTRFLVVAPHPETPEPRQKVKASVAFTALHRPGALSEILQPLSEEGVNLTMLQSLPLPGKTWEYIFHMDMIFDNPERARKTIGVFGSKLNNVWVMGVYPLAETR